MNIMKGDERQTWKNWSQSFSNGKAPGVKNRNAIFGFFDITGGVFRISLITTRDAISLSDNSLAGVGGSHSESQPWVENT